MRTLSCVDLVELGPDGSLIEKNEGAEEAVVDRTELRDDSRRSITLWVSGTDELMLDRVERASQGACAPVRACDGTNDAVEQSVRAALEAITESSRPQTLLLMDVREYATWAAQRFAIRCNDRSRRMRPSDSLRLEPSELVRTIASHSTWEGKCYLLATSGMSIENLATALARNMGGTTVIMCEILLIDQANLEEPGCLVVSAAPGAGRISGKASLAEGGRGVIGRSELLRSTLLAADIGHSDVR